MCGDATAPSHPTDFTYPALNIAFSQTTLTPFQSTLDFFNDLFYTIRDILRGIWLIVMKAFSFYMVTPDAVPH